MPDPLQALPGARPEPEAFVDRREMARQLGVSLPTLDRMVARNDIPSCTFGRRTRRFRASTVIAHLAQRELRQQNEAA